MYNSILEVKIDSVAPYSTERKGKIDEGLNIGATLQTNAIKVFDDVDFGKNRNGLKTILDGVLPIKGTAVRLAFIKKKDTTFDVSGEGKIKNIPVTVDDIFTGPIKNGVITIKLKLNVKQLNEEIAGLFASRLNDFVEIKIKSSQQDLPLNEQPPLTKDYNKKIIPIKEAKTANEQKKKRTSGKTTLDVNK